MWTSVSWISNMFSTFPLVYFHSVLYGCPDWDLDCRTWCFEPVPPRLHPMKKWVMVLGINYIWVRKEDMWVFSSVCPVSVSLKLGYLLSGHILPSGSHRFPGHPCVLPRVNTLSKWYNITAAPLDPLLSPRGGDEALWAESWSFFNHYCSHEGFIFYR